VHIVPLKSKFHQLETKPPDEEKALIKLPEIGCSLSKLYHNEFKFRATSKRLSSSSIYGPDSRSLQRIYFASAARQTNTLQNALRIAAFSLVERFLPLKY
jgi:hypothetical protein